MTVWFTSDTHFCHKYVAGLRGFSTPEEHDRAIIDNWNSVIRKEDIVWLLGDTGLGNEAKTLALVRELNGRKQLITGNHDPVWPAHRRARNHQEIWLTAFESVQAFARTSVCGTDVLMSHFPYTGDTDGREEDRGLQYRLRDFGQPLVHGHVHSRDRLTFSGTGTVQVHAGLDAWGLFPVKDTQVKELLDQKAEE